MKTKMKKQNKKTLISALLLLIGLVVIFGVALLLRTGNFNDQSRASYGSILVGKLIRDSDTSKCVGTKVKAPYHILKNEGVCTALVVSRSLAEPLVDRQVMATGTLKGLYFYVRQLTLSKSTPTPKRTPTPSIPSINHAPIFKTTTLPSGYIGRPYSASVYATDIDPGDSLTMTISGLPFGLNVGPCAVPVAGGQITCYISGTPVNSGRYSVQATVTDNHQTSTTKTFSLSVIGVVSVTPTPKPL